MVSALGGFALPDFAQGGQNRMKRITSFADNLDPGYKTSHTMQGRTKLIEGRSASSIERANESKNARAATYNMPGAFARDGESQGSQGNDGNFDWGQAGIKPFDPTETANKVKDQTLSQEDFLKLLTVQLQAQDPTKPADNNQLVTQMSQLSMVESLNTINSNMKDVISTVTSSSALNATSLIGTYVYTEDNKAFYNGSVATWSIDAGDKMYHDLKLTIKNAETGEVVFTDTAEGLSGEIKFGWDGTFDPEGKYEPPTEGGDTSTGGSEKPEGGDGTGGTTTPGGGSSGSGSAEGKTGFIREGDSSTGSGNGGNGSNSGDGDKGDGSNGNTGEGGDKEDGDKPPKCDPGVYILEVTGVDSSGKTVSLPTKSLALVTSVTLGKTMEDTMLSLLGHGQISFAKANRVTI